MEKKSPSKYFPPLKRRDGLEYPPAGKWQRNASLNKLQVLAKNLDTSKAKDHPDKLHSVPTPWARLLLFESALFDGEHPAHEEVTKQWRGLLGLLALSNVLGLDDTLECRKVNLANAPDGDLKNAFLTLRPRHEETVTDQKGERVIDHEENKWNSFDLIRLDNVLIGATSPRTMVFTAVGHVCPDVVPFRTRDGRLTDPAEHYSLKRDGGEFLAILRQWVKDFIGIFKNQPGLKRYLGTIPSDRDAQPISRHEQIVNALDAWSGAIDGAIRDWNKLHPSGLSSVAVGAPGRSKLSAPFDIIRPVHTAELPPKSDLFLKGHTDVIVCFRPEESVLLDESGKLLENIPILVWRGHPTNPGEALPRTFSFVPKEVKVIVDPSSLLEDALIEAEIAHDAAYYLSSDTHQYLLPFREKITEYFTGEELERLGSTTKLTSDGGVLRLEVRIPLENGNTIRVQKEYRRDSDVISSSDLRTQRLAMWPDFESSQFEHYFYFRSKGGSQKEVVFTPMSEPVLSREIPEKGHTWFMSRQPLQGFVGSVADRQGLLLIRRNRISPPTKKWNVAVDFGSTHTNVFYTEPDPLRDKAPVKPLLLRSRVRVLTALDELEILANFFGYGAEKTGLPTVNDTKMSGDKAITAATQLVLPILTPADFKDNWLPREGQIFLASIRKVHTQNRIETDMKWRSEGDNYATRSFLRSLMFLVEAEAIANGAVITSVSHAYPTAFTGELAQKQSNEWQGVKGVVGLPIDDEPLSEAVAVVRHLWAEQGALTATNAISLDIGGSTTDIALWARKKLLVQESIKIAAGAATKYAELSVPFGAWLEETLKGQPFNETLVVKDRRAFHATLNELDVAGHLSRFINTIKENDKRDEVKPFISLISILFGAVSYYVGLLARKVKLGLDDQSCYLYFCGRGGQLYWWIPEADRLVSSMFMAGLVGPAISPTPASANAGTKRARGARIPDTEIPSPTASSLVTNIRVSDYPKQEVGRGLLVKHEVNAKIPPTVTAGESGYNGLKWSDNIDYQVLERLQSSIPALSELKELAHFIDALQTSKAGKDAGDALRLGSLFPSDTYRGTLRQRISDNVDKGASKALIEPLFMTEVKVLIEMAVGQLIGREVRDLFD